MKLFLISLFRFLPFVFLFLPSCCGKKVAIRASKHNETCPVSSTMNISKMGGFYSYPVDIYGNTNTFEHMKVFFDCNFSLIQQDQKAICSDGNSTKICPVYQQNIVDGLTKTKNWKTNSALWQLLVSLNDWTKTVNLVVFGGSETLGGDTAGCCARSECRKVDKNNYRVPTCAWPHYLGQWMNRTFKANVIIHNLALGGATSLYMSTHAIEQLEKIAKLSTLTSSDVVFLDHSINDRVLQNKESISSLERGLETLIRQLYLYSTPGSWPTIIVIELDSFSRYDQYHYSHSYQKIATYYQLPIYSYRDAVLSQFATTNQKQYLQWMQLTHGVVNSAIIHPPWHVHLFIADMLAGMLQTQFTELNTIDSDEAKISSLRYSNRSAVDLPVNLIPYNVTTPCNKAHAPLLSISYDDVKANLSVTGTFKSVPIGGWETRADPRGHGQGGFMVDYNTTHDTNNEARLIFTLQNITYKQILEKKNMRFNLQITYFRTYLDGGIAWIEFCGQRVSNAVLDGLWSNYDTYRYSHPDTFVLSNIMCVNEQNTAPTVEIVHVKKKFDAGLRETHRVKILAVKLCIV